MDRFCVVLLDNSTGERIVSMDDENRVRRADYSSVSALQQEMALDLRQICLSLRLFSFAALRSCVRSFYGTDAMSGCTPTRTKMPSVSC